ncbi:ATP-binding cassette domain-containing protein, partial [Acinetobacter baumannii]
DDRDYPIRVRGLVNAFGEQTVHEGLDLDVRRGEILGVVGGSGTGKSVLSRALAAHVGRAPGAVVLRSDVIRRELAGAGPTGKL